MLHVYQWEEKGQLDEWIWNWWQRKKYQITLYLTPYSVNSTWIEHSCMKNETIWPQDWGKYNRKITVHTEKDY
jgi:hypothetical protein